MIEKLRHVAKETNSILCFGIDPVLERIKEEGETKDRIINYFSNIIDLLIAENQISALKFNYAFFAQYGFDGFYALKELMDRYRSVIPIIFDGKRGDIGKSSVAYSREVYDFWGADGVTVSPYMGEDSIKPFLREDKIVYVLCRTSNPSATDFQELKTRRKPIYLYVAERISRLRGTGLVVGATSKAVKKLKSFSYLPFLIPGVGAQGGSIRVVMNTIKEDPWHHRINSSSSIAYAYERYKLRYDKAALKEAKNLNKRIGRYL